jgi:hypothetical protein
MKALQTNSTQLTMTDVSVDEIIKLVANHFGFEENFSKIITRKTEYIHAKHIAIYLIKKNYPKMTLGSIGKYFNGIKGEGLDHATVLHAIRKINNFIDVEKEVEKDVKFLENLIKLKKNTHFDNYKIDRNYYYICLNNMNSMKIGNGKAIVTTGLSYSEIVALKECLPKIGLKVTEERNHTQTDMYILESKKNVKK